MAENTSFMHDPGTSQYDDWFELFNPSGTPADLTGYYLTDTLNDRFQYQIPAGYIVPTNGFLLVWADNKTSANSTNGPNLHVPFNLAKSGEAIGLFHDRCERRQLRSVIVPELLFIRVDQRDAELVREKHVSVREQDGIADFALSRGIVKFPGDLAAADGLGVGQLPRSQSFAGA